MDYGEVEVEGRGQEKRERKINPQLPRDIDNSQLD